MVRKESLCVLDATPNLTKGISFTLITTHSLHYVYTHNTGTETAQQKGALCQNDSKLSQSFIWRNQDK
jgi:hypothetical protein